LDEIVKLLAEQRALIIHLANEVAFLRSAMATLTHPSDPLVTTIFETVGSMAFSASDLFARTESDGEFEKALHACCRFTSSKQLGRRLASISRSQPLVASRRLERVKRSKDGMTWVIRDVDRCRSSTPIDIKAIARAR
jgi:hypothetical protein